MAGRPEFCIFEKTCIVFPAGGLPSGRRVLKSYIMKNFFLVIAALSVLVSCSGGAAARKEQGRGIPVKVMAPAELPHVRSRGGESR